MGGERFYYLAEYENEQKSAVGNKEFILLAVQIHL